MPNEYVELPSGMDLPVAGKPRATRASHPTSDPTMTAYLITARE
jgi:hypothetical protein